MTNNEYDVPCEFFMIEQKLEKEFGEVKKK
jgi:hypothetical protein